MKAIKDCGKSPSIKTLFRTILAVTVASLVYQPAQAETIDFNSPDAHTLADYSNADVAFPTVGQNLFNHGDYSNTSFYSTVVLGQEGNFDILFNKPVATFTLNFDTYYNLYSTLPNSGIPKPLITALPIPSYIEVTAYDSANHFLNREQGATDADFPSVTLFSDAIMSASFNYKGGDGFYKDYYDPTGPSTIVQNTIVLTGFSYELASTAPVPEPETYAMMLAGLGLLGFIRARRKG